MVRIDRMTPEELPALKALYRSLAMDVHDLNLQHFSVPRVLGTGFAIETFLARDGDRVVGTIGYIDVPARIGGRPVVGRWPVSQFLLPEYRGRGLGRDMMDLTRQGVEWLLVIGGTAESLPSRQKGWLEMGFMQRYRSFSPCLRPLRQPDRLRRGSRRRPPDALRWAAPRGRVQVERMEGSLSADPPWLAAAENGVPRNAAFTDFTYGGVLREHFSLHRVTVAGELAGFFVLAARVDRRPLLSLEIVDLDAVEGMEPEVIESARRAALACGDVVRFRVLSPRLEQVLRSSSRWKQVGRDIVFKVSCVTGSADDLTGPWRLTYGDHDQYRIRAASQVFEPFLASGADRR